MKFTDRGVERTLSFIPAGVEMRVGDRAGECPEDRLFVYDILQGQRLGKPLFKKNVSRGTRRHRPVKPGGGRWGVFPL